MLQGRLTKSYQAAERQCVPVDGSDSRHHLMKSEETVFYSYYTYEIQDYPHFSPTVDVTVTVETLLVTNLLRAACQNRSN